MTSPAAVAVTGAPASSLRLPAFLGTLLGTQAWVALAATGLGLYAMLALGVPVTPRPLFVIFASGLFIYSVDAWLDGQQGWRGFVPIGVGLVLCCVAFGSSSAGVLTLVIPGLALCSAYGLPLGLTTRAPRLKNIPGFKAIFVAGSLTTAALAVPILETGFWPDPGRLASTAIFLFLFTLTNVVTFDIRDVARDAAERVPTLPVLWGARTCRLRVTVLHFVVGAWVLLLGLPISPEAPAFLIAGLILLWRLPSGAPPRLHELVLDGLAVVLPVFFLLT